MYTADHYIRLFLLWIGIAVLLYLLMLVVFSALNIEFPQFLRLAVSALASGYLVYRFLLARIG